MKLCKKFFPFHVQQNTNEFNSVPNTMLNGQAKKVQKGFQEILIRLSNDPGNELLVRRRIPKMISS